MTRSLWSDLLKNVRTWWTSDRLRISPREGKLLRIQTGDLLTIKQMDLEVIDRSTEFSQDGQSLRLNCRGQSGFAVLCVTIDSNITCQSATLTQSGFQQAIDPDDVQVWPRLIANTD